MRKYSVCIEMMFNNLPLGEKFAKVAECGFSAAEIWGWAHRDLSELKEASRTSGVALSSMCVDSKDKKLADLYRAIPIVADGSASVFAEVVSESVEAAGLLGVKNLIVTTGQERTDISREKQHENIVSALSLAAPVFERNNITAVLEPLNILVDHKGYYLYSSEEAADILKTVGSSNVKMLFDIYHQQITEGNIINNINRYIDLIGHFHVADNPGRHEPGTGELNYSSIFRAIDETCYDGYIGLEFSPVVPSADALLKVKAI